MSDNAKLKLLDGVLEILKRNNRIGIEKCDNDLIKEFEKRKLVLVVNEKGRKYLEITHAGRTFEGFEQESKRIESENEDKELKRESNKATIKSVVFQKWYVYATILSVIISVISLYFLIWNGK